ncbi:hypothetical protein P3342_004311 [Pyrenophora teres f. teres]|nr:hypothetical protein P3342_004311 [Pyrenophora teres f. teres]
MVDTINTMHVKCTNREQWPSKVEGSLNDWFQVAIKYSGVASTTQTATKTTGGNVATSFEPSTEMSTTPTPEPSSTDAATSTVQSSNAASPSTSVATSSSPSTSGPPPPPQSSQSGDGPPAVIPANPTETTVSTAQSQSTTAPVAAPNTDPPGPTSGQSSTETAHVHAQSTTTSGSNNSTTTPADPPAFGTTAIAGTAAGGTVGLALIVGLIYFLMRRRKHRAFKPSPADMWDPTHHTDRKPTLPVLQHDTTYGRYGEPPTQQMNKAELHSNALLPPPPQQHNAFQSQSPDDAGGGANRYYQPSPNHHGNLDTRFPQLPAHPPMSSPASPVSALSTPHIWPASTTPTLRLSNPDARGDGLRSPVSELRATTPLPSTRSAELSGDQIRASHGATPPAELHDESLAPHKVGQSKSGGGVGPGAVEMDGEGGKKAGVSTNF